MTANERPVPWRDLDPEDRPGEVWRPVVGFESTHEVSNHSRVRSVNRTVTNKNGYAYTVAGRMVSQKKKNGRNPVAYLHRDGKKTKVFPEHLTRDAFPFPSYARVKLLGSVGNWEEDLEQGTEVRIICAVRLEGYGSAFGVVAPDTNPAWGTWVLHDDLHEWLALGTRLEGRMYDFAYFHWIDDATSAVMCGAPNPYPLLPTVTPQELNPKPGDQVLLFDFDSATAFDVESGIVWSVENKLPQQLEQLRRDKDGATRDQNR